MDAPTQLPYLAMDAPTQLPSALVLDHVDLHSHPRDLTTRIRVIREKIYEAPDVGDSTKEKDFESLFDEQDKIPMEDYGSWLSKVEERKGKEYLDAYIKWIERPDPQLPNYENMSDLDCLDMLRHADWSDGDEPSQLVKGRLWFGNIHADPEYRLRGLYGNPLAVRLNGHALRPDPTDEAVPGSVVLPPLYAQIRYKTPRKYQLNAISLGNIFQQPLSNSGNLFSEVPWKDTGFVLAADVSKSPLRLLVVYRPSNIDLVEGFQREQNTEEDIPVLCNALKPFTLGELSIKDEQDEIKPLLTCKLEIVQVVV